LTLELSNKTKKDMKTATREQEIKALKALVELNGYLADHFGKDLEKMIGNIRNDFPIETGTKFNDRAEALEERIRDDAQSCREIIAEMCGTMLVSHEKTGDALLYDQACEKLGMKELIALKRSLGLHVTESEIDYLLKKVSH
jgi:hypothetical protein